MDSWKEFELEWTKFLKDSYGDVAYFEHQGFEDSTRPDILVRTKSGKEFYIETKKCPAQCGQFVLLPDDKTRRFIYSPKNINKINDFSEQIINFMNNNYDSFKNAGTAGKNIVFDGMEHVFINWIIDKYEAEKVELFATNNKVIISLDQFDKIFSVTAKYRIKRSGSSNVGSKRIDNVLTYIKNNFDITAYRKTNNGSLFVQSTKNIHNLRFNLDGFEYMFSYVSNNFEFEVRKLSKTFNANVIFSIDLKNPALKGLTPREIINALK